MSKPKYRRVRLFVSVAEEEISRLAAAAGISKAAALKWIRGEYRVAAEDAIGCYEFARDAECPEEIHFVNSDDVSEDGMYIPLGQQSRPAP